MKALKNISFNKIWVTGVAVLSGLALTGAYYLFRKNQKINKKLNKWFGKLCIIYRRKIETKQ